MSVEWETLHIFSAFESSRSLVDILRHQAVLVVNDFRHRSLAAIFKI